MNNAVFWKTMENVPKHRDIRLITNETRRNYSVSKSNYHTTICFSENLLAKEINKIFMNKPVHLGLTILELSKIDMYEFQYDHVKPKHEEKVILQIFSYKNTDSFKVYIKTEYMYLDIAKNVEAIFDTSNYKCDRPLPNGEK